MSQSFFVAGPLPGLNEMLASAKGAGGTGRRYSALKKIWTETVWAVARSNRIRPVARATIEFTWVERNRQRNPDNIASAKKFILDGLVMAKVLKNDGWGEIAGWTDKFTTEGTAGVHVTLVDG
jgi:hypothetical protein